MSQPLATRRAPAEARHSTDCGCMGCKMARASAADYAADLARARGALNSQLSQQLSDEHTRRLLAACAAGIDGEDAARGEPGAAPAPRNDTPTAVGWLLALAIALALAAAFWPRGAAATELHLVAHGASHHFSSTRDYDGRRQNEENKGLALRWQITPAWSVQAGGYRNSHDRDSLYALADWTPLRAGAWQAGAFAGAATNYVREYRVTREPCGVQLDSFSYRHRVRWCTREEVVRTRNLPAAGLLARWQGERVSAVVRAVPPAEKSGGVVTLELGWRL